MFIKGTKTLVFKFTDNVSGQELLCERLVIWRKGKRHTQTVLIAFTTMDIYWKISSLDTI